ncbi:hypothetical protein BDE02_06G017000 [Populus trichocarpa]|nr:hypothetical protein BDE02_06G017000 [Populus trichocarpa]
MRKMPQENQESTVWYPSRNQTYDKKENTVTITVVGCCPEKIKKKIYSKGGPTVKCVEIKPPPKEKPKPEKKPEPKPEKRTRTKTMHIVINGEMDAVVAEVGVTMCAEVHMFVKSTTPRHAQSCKGKSNDARLCAQLVFSSQWSQFFHG